jgi:uncharacterized protein (DUF1697 family)
MTWVVFLRGVNVGGARVFRPSELVKKLTGLNVVNHGAAGTFIVTGKVTAGALRRRFARALPFPAEMMICSAQQLRDLVAAKPFGDGAMPEDFRWYVTVIPARSRKLPRFPIERPAGRWEVRLFAVRGPFVLSVWRHGMKGLTYATDVLEEFDLRGTTRNWNTMVAVCAKLPGR